MEKIFPILFLSLLFRVDVESAKKQTAKLDLSNSYLPVAMQVIASLLDQLEFDPDEKPAIARPATAAVVAEPDAGDHPKPGGSSTSKPTAMPTLPHRPGNFGPARPPNPADIKLQVKVEDAPPILLPPHGHAEFYSVLRPDEDQDLPAQKVLLLPEVAESVVPIPAEAPLSLGFLPIEDSRVKTEAKLLEGRTSEESEDAAKLDWRLGDPELSEEALQFLSPTIKDLLKLGHDDTDDRLIIPDADKDDFAEDQISHKMKGTASRPIRSRNSGSKIRLSLLYDQFSRDAKKQQLNAYQGYAATLLEDLAGSWSGGASDQLKMVLQRMLDRGDCTHEFANNRAKEIVQDLKNSTTIMSRELRYLVPLYFDKN